ncbi:hypothetical protein ACXO2Y_07100 [Lactobacillus delbrueckii subsp. bulgaricus]|nr:hypothetical protein [Lactobacillus delbrueckii subsp. bulgaricus]MBT8903439.1 hypothetical protein [Lactobacillus delbrueckii subsp. bulgaricus]MBT8908218.1 hypothetical protein [Lactobacillus delbrueckii subsp. bulgaricus]MBT8915605.1 hypothetical protein [Lactobacillus delbrueckii subsp. bulgaricus]MBT8986950.1 hypothetical protein [Lactobacillus delbrueckii subsp. bulgaricus]
MKELYLPITKSARQFGYLIWNSKYDTELESMFAGKDQIQVHFNGFDLGEKHIDRKYHRISLGFKFTKALPPDQNSFSINVNKGILEIKTFNAAN